MNSKTRKKSKKDNKKLKEKRKLGIKSTNWLKKKVLLSRRLKKGLLINQIVMMRKKKFLQMVKDQLQEERNKHRVDQHPVGQLLVDQLKEHQEVQNQLQEEWTMIKKKIKPQKQENLTKKLKRTTDKSLKMVEILKRV